MTRLVQVYFMGLQVLIINNTEKSSVFILVSGLNHLKESVLLVGSAFLLLRPAVHYNIHICFT